MLDVHFLAKFNFPNCKLLSNTAKANVSSCLRVRIETDDIWTDLFYSICHSYNGLLYPFRKPSCFFIKFVTRVYDNREKRFVPRVQFFVSSKNILSVALLSKSSAVAEMGAQCCICHFLLMNNTNVPVLGKLLFKSNLSMSTITCYKY